MKKVTILVVLVSMLCALPAFADVYTQLVKVSNEDGVLVVDVQSKSDSGEVPICLHRGAFKISETLERRVVAVGFDNLLFLSPNYKTIVGYSSEYRKFTWVYTFNDERGETYATIPEEWTSILRVHIMYNTTDEIASLSWAGSPAYKVLGEADCHDITGDYLPMPSDLQDFPLPVQMHMYSAVIEENVAKVTWRTETELDNLGFNIYKSDLSDSGFSRINDEMVRGQGSTSTAHTYEYIDSSIEKNKTYWYTIETVSLDGLSTFYGPFQTTLSSAVRENINGMPTEYTLHQNYPNPFNPKTQIRYELPDAGNVELTIYNLLGNPIKLLVSENQNAGVYNVVWDGTNLYGERVESGIFLYELRVGEHVFYQKMTLLK